MKTFLIIIVSFYLGFLFGEDSQKTENYYLCQDIFSDIRKGKLSRDAAFNKMKEKSCFVYINEELHNKSLYKNFIKNL